MKNLNHMDRMVDVALDRMLEMRFNDGVVIGKRQGVLIGMVLGAIGLAGIQYHNKKQNEKFEEEL